MPCRFQLLIVPAYDPLSKLSLVRGEESPIPARLLTNFLTNVHAMRIAGQLTLETAFVVAAALDLDRLHPLDRLVSAVAECLETRCHVEPGPVDSIRIDDRGPFAGRVVTANQQEKNQE